MKNGDSIMANQQGLIVIFISLPCTILRALSLLGWALQRGFGMLYLENRISNWEIDAYFCDLFMRK